MDRSWIFAKRNTAEYINGAERWVQWAMASVGKSDGKILCPCQRCCCQNWFNERDVLGDILWNGFLQSYTRWHFHGESLLPSVAVGEDKITEDISIQKSMQDGDAADPASEEIMEKLEVAETQQTEEGSQSSTCAKDDAYAQVTGEKRHGHVRLMGMSTTSKNILKSRSTAKNRNLSQRVKEIEDKYKFLEMELAKMKEQNLNKQDMKLVKLIYPGSSTAGARAYLVSDEPTKLVDGVPLGSGWVEVLVKSVSEPKTRLLRDEQGMVLLQDAMVRGVPIAWLKNYVQDV